ncbi:hypothetical protein MMC10_003479 [Thelotrema lepadinum]|nr:hypothetical protein [Thelotrema lepadinum]
MPTTRTQRMRQLVNSTIPLAKLVNVTSDTNSNNAFFCLPVEIREEVYAHAFGGGIIELSLVDEGVHFPPRMARKWRTGHGTDVKILEGWEWQGRYHGGDRKGPVSAFRWLLTCKQSYREAMDHMFATNALRLKDFDESHRWLGGPSFGKPHTIWNLRGTIAVEWLARVRKLELSWDFPTFGLHHLHPEET